MNLHQLSAKLDDLIEFDFKSKLSELIPIWGKERTGRLGRILGPKHGLLTPEERAEFVHGVKKSARRRMDQLEARRQESKKFWDRK